MEYHLVQSKFDCCFLRSFKNSITMDPSNGKLIFTSIIMIFAFLCIIYQSCEFFGCTDLCKRRPKVNVIQVQQLHQQIPIVAAEIQRENPGITVLAFEVIP